MKPRTFEEKNDNITILPEIINTRFIAARNCAVPACDSCMLERYKKRSTNNKKVKPIPEKEGALLRHKIEVGYFFQLINLFVRLLAVCLMVMGGSHMVVIIKELLFTMIMLLVLFGLKIKSL